MAYIIDTGALSTLRCRSHWHAELFKVSRRDGGGIRFSSLSRVVVFEGDLYTPTVADRLDDVSESGLNSGDAEMVGVIGPDTITSVDLQRDLFNGARVDHYTIDWRRRKVYQHEVWFVDRAWQDGRLWRASLNSMTHNVENTIGDAYTSLCGAIFGDERCKKVVVEQSGTVTSVVDPQLEFASGVTGTSQYYRYGVVKWTTGNNRGTSTRVHGFASGSFALAEPTRFDIRVGDQFSARPGCDGTAFTCKNVHANLANFRGNERQKNSKQLIISRGVIG